LNLWAEAVNTATKIPSNTTTGTNKRTQELEY
jgi:hypothetical protein